MEDGGGFMIGVCIGLICGFMVAHNMTRNCYQTEACEKNYATRTITDSGFTKWWWNCDLPAFATNSAGIHIND